MPNKISNCCKAPVHVEGTDEGTNHYECDKCGKPCDPFVSPDNKRELSKCCGKCSPSLETADYIAYGTCQNLDCSCHTSPDPFIEKTLKEFDEKFMPKEKSFPENSFEEKINQELLKFMTPLRAFLSSTLNAQRGEAFKEGNAKKGEYGRKMYQQGYDEARKDILEKVEQIAIEKSEVLKNNGYGNVPILFEKIEILNLLSTDTKNLHGDSKGV